MNPVRIGIIGCGPIAQAAHLPATVKAANATLVAVCDRSERLRTAAHVIHGATHAYADAAELLADPAVEAVIVAVADAFHVPLALAALHAGKHVLVEKPLSDQLAGTAELAALQAATGLRVHVGNNKRYDAGIEYAHDMAWGPLGQRIAYRGWYCDSHARYTVTDNLQPTFVRDSDILRPAGDPKGDRRRYLLLTHGSHLVDTARYICGPISHVQTQLRELDGVKSWFSAVTFADGTMGHLDLTVTIQGDHHEGFQLYSQHGSIQAKTYLPWYLKSSDVEVFTSSDQQYHRPLAPDGYSYRRQIEGFCAAIRGATPVRAAQIADGIAAVAVLTAMSRSAEQYGTRVAVADAGGLP
jgi:predicted dehydrogenase